MHAYDMGYVMHVLSHACHMHGMTSKSTLVAVTYHASTSTSHHTCPSRPQYKPRERDRHKDRDRDKDREDRDGDLCAGLALEHLVNLSSPSLVTVSRHYHLTMLFFH
jgi:hypothetical protein